MQNEKYSPKVKGSKILFDSQPFFSVLFNGSPDAIFILDSKDFAILECNEKALTLFEAKSRLSLINLSAFRLFDNEPIEFSKNLHESNIKNIGEHTQELAFRTLKQNVFWGRLDKHSIKADKQYYIVLRISKATDYFNAEEALSLLLRGTSKVTGLIFFKELSRLLCKTFDVKYAFIAKISGDKKTLSVLESYGSFKEINFEKYLLQDSLIENVVNGYTTFYPADTKKLFPGDDLVKKNNICAFMGTPVFGSSGEVVGIIAFMDDVPIKEVQNSRYILSIFASRTAAEMQRIRSKEILTEQARKLAISDNIKDKLLSVISNDLKNPVFSVMGFSELLKKNVNSYDKKNILDKVEIIDDAIRNIYFLLENLSDWSRIFRGDIRQSLQSISINEIIEENLSFFSYMLKSKEINVLVELNKCPQILVDKNMIISIMRNIISNAIKYSSNGSEIIIKYSLSGSFVKLSIQDSGIGMSEDKIDQIMQAEDNLPEIDLQKNDNVRLGLSLSKNFIRRIGGVLHFESSIKKGTKVIICLPKA